MRILQISPYYFPSIGGVQRHVQLLSEEMVRQGHAVTVVTMAHQRGLTKQTLLNGVQIERLSSIGFSIFEFPPELSLYIRQHQSEFDVIHAHNVHNLSLLISILAAQPQKVVISPYYHPQASSSFADVLHRLYDPCAAFLIQKRAASVVCLSNGEARNVTGKLGLPSAQVNVIPSGIHPMQGNKPTVETNLILSVGRLTAYKHLDRVIKAIPHLPEDFHLVIIGTGEQETYLRQLTCDLKLENRVRFLGRVDSDDEVQNWYLRSRVVVSMSTAESFGISVLEGLAADCQIVCSDIPAFRDFAAEFPDFVTLIAPTDDDKSIACALENAANRTGATPDLRRYSWVDIANRHLNIYRHLQHSPELKAYRVGEKNRV